MCGIGFLLAPKQLGRGSNSSTNTAVPSICDCWPSILHNIRQRGPDDFRSLQANFAGAIDAPSSSSGNTDWTWSLTSSVLSLRGEGVTRQPLTSQDGRFYLAWNGQIFDHLYEESSPRWKDLLEHDRNDGRTLFDEILAEVEELGAGQDIVATITKVLSRVEGPYAFVFVDAVMGKVVFGRDPLGRRSLIVHRQEDENILAIMSVTSSQAPHNNLGVQEVACSSLWTIDIGKGPSSLVATPRNADLGSRYLLKELRESTSSSPSTQSDFTSDARLSLKPEEHRAYQTEFLKVLSESVRRRVTSVNTSQPEDEARVAMLFSGGLDCTTLALLADGYIPKHQPIDLLNVAFENPRAIEAARREAEKKRMVSTKRSQDRKLLKEYQEAKHPKGPAAKKAEEKQDADEEGTPLTEANEIDIYEVPDRVTGRASYQELCRLSPSRVWNFVSVNVTYREYCEAKDEVLGLMYPSSSVMDLSIASALYFASRGIGQISDLLSGEIRSYSSTAKILISGLGADELLGGYSRHRAAYAQNQKRGLLQELQLDLDRLPERNLARDDRILSCHGKESRYPFLSHHVIQFLTCIPVEAKIDLENFHQDGQAADKKLLRNVAKDLGLTFASQLKKRAMQFGTRAAKIDLDSSKIKGHHSLHA